jgi:hypothetical protein
MINQDNGGSYKNKPCTGSIPVQGFLLGYKLWTPEETALLQNNFKKKSLAQIAALLNRTIKSVWAKAASLGLRQRENRGWTLAEETELSNLCESGKSEREIARILGRGMRSIAGKKERLNLKRNHYKWSEQDNAYLCEHFNSGAKEEMVQDLGVKWCNIVVQANKLGLYRDHNVALRQRKMPLTKQVGSKIIHAWSEEEKSIVRECFCRPGAKKSDKVYGLLQHRTKGAIMYCAKKMGLHRQKFYYNEYKLRQILDLLYPNCSHEDWARPPWLLNPKTGKRLEIDRFYPELNMAIEYNGEFHYKPVLLGSGHTIEEEEQRLREQQNRDSSKSRICKERGIQLVVIKHDDVLTLSNVKQLIERQTCQS